MPVHRDQFNSFDDYAKAYHIPVTYRRFNDNWLQYNRTGDPALFPGKK